MKTGVLKRIWPSLVTDYHLAVKDFQERHVTITVIILLSIDISLGRRGFSMKT